MAIRQKSRGSGHKRTGHSTKKAKKWSQIASDAPQVHKTGADLFISRMFGNEQPNSEPSYTGIVVLGTMESAKSAFTQTMYARAGLFDKFTIDNVNLVQSMDLYTLLNHLDYKQWQWAILEDAVVNVSGRSAMSGKSKFATGVLTVIRHKLREKRLAAIEAGIDCQLYGGGLVASYLTQTYTGLDPIPRTTSNAFCFKDWPMGTEHKRGILKYLANDNWTKRELSKISDGLAARQFSEVGSQTIFAMRGGHIGKIDLAKWYPLHDKLPWKIIEPKPYNPREAWDEILEELTQIYKHQSDISLDRMTMHLYRNHPDQIKAASTIRHIYRGMCEEWKEDKKQDAPVLERKKEVFLHELPLEEIFANLIERRCIMPDFPYHSKNLIEMIDPKRERWPANKALTKEMYKNRETIEEHIDCYIFQKNVRNRSVWVFSKKKVRKVPGEVEYITPSKVAASPTVKVTA